MAEGWARAVCEAVAAAITDDPAIATVIFRGATIRDQEDFRERSDSGEDGLDGFAVRIEPEEMAALVFR